MSTESSAFDVGMSARRHVLGDEYVDRASSTSNPIASSFQRYLAEHCWAVSWADGTLTRRDRTLITLAVIAALGREEELELHIRAARANGIADEELFALIVHVGVYSGVLNAVAAHRGLQVVLTEGKDEG